MSTREQMRREAEAIKDTEKELEGLDPVEATVKQNAEIVFSLRFTQDEMSQLRQAAQARGIKLSELIREGAIEAASRVGPGPRERAVREARELIGAAARALDRV